MELRLTHARYACAVARHGSFTAAARELGVRQPTVSGAVAGLERQLGGALVERSRSGVRLSAYGAAILPALTQVLGAVAEVDERVAAWKEPARKVLRLALSQIVDAQVIGRLVAPFQRAHPDVEVVYKECTVAEFSGRLLRRSIDVVIAPPEAGEPGWRRLTLYRDRLRFLSRGGVGGGAPRIEVRDVARQRLVLSAGVCGLRQFTEALLAADGRALDVYPGEALSYPMIAEWADLGLGAGVLPESRIAGRPDGAVVVRAGKPVHISYVAMWHARAQRPRHVEAFLAHARRAAPDLFPRTGGVWEALPADAGRRRMAGKRA